MVITLYLLSYIPVNHTPLWKQCEVIGALVHASVFTPDFVATYWTQKLLIVLKQECYDCVCTPLPSSVGSPISYEYIPLVRTMQIWCSSTQAHLNFMMQQLKFMMQYHLRTCRIKCEMIWHHITQF